MKTKTTELIPDGTSQYVSKTLTSEEMANYVNDNESINFDDVPVDKVQHIKRLFNHVVTSWPKTKQPPRGLTYLAQYNKGNDRKLQILLGDGQENPFSIVLQIIGRAKNRFDFDTFIENTTNISVENASWSKDIRHNVTNYLRNVAEDKVDAITLS